MRYVCKNPPGGGGERNPYQLIDYIYFLWQDFSADTNIFDLVALTLTLTYFWKKLEFVAARGISPVRTDPDLVVSPANHSGT